MSELAGLVPGEVLAFSRSAAEPASLLVAGSEMFRAIPARCGDTRAARMFSVVAERPAAQPDAKEKSK